MTTSLILLSVHSCESGIRRDRWQSSECHRELAFIVLLIGELASEVVAVRLHVEVAMPAQVEEDGA